MSLAGAIINYTCNTLSLYQLVASLTTFIVLHSLQFLQARYRRYQLFRYYSIPGPRPNLLEGNYGLFKRRPYTCEMDQELKNRYGRNFGVFIGDQPWLFVTDLEIIRKIFIEDSKNFKKRARIFITSIFGEHSILFAEYSRWKLYRKILSPPFSRYVVKGDNSTHFIEETVELVSGYIDERLTLDDSGRQTATISIHDLMKSAALRMISVIAVMLPNIQIGVEDKYVRSLDLFLSNADNHLLDWAIRFPFVSAVISYLAQKYEGALTALIKSRIDLAINDYAKGCTDSSEDNRNDQQNQVIDTLIRLHCKGKICREAVMSNALSVLLAGYDTTSTTLNYIFWVLAKHTEVQKRLRSDLEAHGIDAPYLEQVINETFRLYPTVRSFTTRLATENVLYDGLMIPKGTLVIYNSWLINHDPEIWPDPKRFDPDRFCPGQSHHPSAFAPFGLGERRCLGYQLALSTIKKLVCNIVISYQLRLKSPENLELITYASSLTKPREKVMIELERVIR